MLLLNNTASKSPKAALPILPPNSWLKNDLDAVINIGNEVKEAVNNTNYGEIILLENLRFYKEETKGDVDFAKKLSVHGDVWVNDAFGTAHRAHASTTIVAQFYKIANKGG